MIRFFVVRLWLHLLGASILAQASAFAEARLLTGDANNQAHERDSFLFDLSQDGRLVLFATGRPSRPDAPSPGIESGGLYIRDLVLDTITFTGATNVGGEGSFSDNGRYVVWVNPQYAIFWRDCQSGDTRAITPGADGASRNPVMSADGRYVAYISVARNIVNDPAKLPDPGRAAVYLYDSQTGQTSIISLTHDGKSLSTGVGSVVPTYEFDFSADGRFVVFSTSAPGVHPSRASANPAYFWLYRRNIENGAIDVVSKNSGGEVPNGNFSTPRIDALGNRILFTGGFVALGGGATLISGYSAVFGYDLYMKDMTTGEVFWISRTRDGSTPDGAFGSYALSGDGSVLAFGSSGTKFVSENTDPGGGSSMDLFRVDVSSSGTNGVTTTLITKAINGTNNVDYFSGPIMPGTGSYVGFMTSSLRSLVGQGTDNAFFKHGVGVGTLPTGTNLPPALAAHFSGNEITLSWADTSEFEPQSSTQIDGPWAALGEPITSSDGIKSVTVSSTLTRRFFRLRRPSTP